MCHYCKKPGHFKKDCRKLAAANQQASEESCKPQHSARNAAVKEQVLSSTSDDEAMVVDMDNYIYIYIYIQGVSSLRSLTPFTPA